MKLRLKRYYVLVQTKTFFTILAAMGADFTGYAIYPFLLIHKKYFLTKSENIEKEKEMMMNHEKIHLRQQTEMFLLVWILQYYGEYFYFRMLRKFSPHQAYLAISFEQEAYLNMHDLAYLTTRKRFAARKYFWKKKSGPIRNWANGRITMS